MTREDLDTATDELTALLEQAEAFFMARNRGVMASVVIGHPEHALTWAKHGTEWGLWVGSTPLLQASREVRLAAAGELDKLLRQLEMNESGLYARLRETTQKVRRFVESLPRQGDKKP